MHEKNSDYGLKDGVTELNNTCLSLIPVMINNTECIMDFAVIKKVHHACRRLHVTISRFSFRLQAKAFFIIKIGGCVIWLHSYQNSFMTS